MAAFMPPAAWLGDRGPRYWFKGFSITLIIQQSPGKGWLGSRAKERGHVFVEMAVIDQSTGVALLVSCNGKQFQTQIGPASKSAIERYERVVAFSRKGGQVRICPGR